jgi:5-(carboxyamino)imidazole ribonucleotide synthase
VATTSMTQQIVPPATIGMLGGGQLGRYALMAASAMGYRTVVLDPDPSAPAGAHANDHLVAAYDDHASLDRLLRECDVVTTEFENPPAAVLERLAATTRVAPRPASVAVAQDRIAEKAFLVDNGFPVGSFAVIADGSDNQSGIASGTGLSSVVAGGAIVKTARLGYDGKGQRSVDSVAGVHAALAELGGVHCVVESRLDLRAELSVIIARTADARVEWWPVAENRHVDGVLDVTVVPARVDPLLADRAIGLAMAIADALDYVGVLAVEFFVVAGHDGDDTLLVNELAPRPHNSGHWTLDASVTSQFEQQIRAVCGVGLGDTSMTAPAVAMANLLGDLWLPSGGDGRVREPRWEAIFDDPHATLHLYGKSQPRPGRKMGHVTVTADTPDQAERRVVALREALLAR